MHDVGVFQYFYEVPLFADFTAWPPTMEDLIAAVNKWKTYPAISCWNIYDEPINGSRKYEDSVKVCAAIREADPGRMLTAVFCVPNIGGWLDPLDFALYDLYPVGRDHPHPSDV